MIMSYERHRAIHAKTEHCAVSCSQGRDHCFNNISKCGQCMHNTELDHMGSDFYTPLKVVGAVIDGVPYPVLTGFMWSNVFGLLSRHTYLGMNGPLVYVPVCGPYHQVILPEDREIEVYPIL